MPLPSFLTGNLWKLGAIGAGLLTVVLSALLLAANFENRGLLKQRDQLQLAINDPETGFVARLSQAETNVATLRVSLDTQRKSFETKAAEREAVLAETQRRLSAAQVQTRAMQTRLDRFLATKPQGATPSARIRDIDERGLTEMVQ